MVEYILKDGKPVCYRHGDLGLFLIKKLPEELKETKTDVIMKGSHNNDHSVENAKLYLKSKGDFIVGYMRAKKGCVLHHIEHGERIKGMKLRNAEMPRGSYELRKQNEDTNEGMKPVID